MHDDPRPQTAEEILALPIGPEFGREARVINGKAGFVPIAPQLACVFHGATDIICCADETGTWMLGRYADGRWFRRRMSL